MEHEKLLTVRASRQWMERLRDASTLQGETMSGFIRRAVAERISVVEDSIGLAPRADSKLGSLPGEGGSHTPNPPDPIERVHRAGSGGASKSCRHGLASCRICKTGVYA